MRNLPGIVLVASSLLAASPALAAPSLTGPYIFNATEICQAQIGVNGGNFVTGVSGSPGGNGFSVTNGTAVTGLNTGQQGGVSQITGIFTLTPTTAGGSSGTVKLTVTQIEGSLLMVQGVPGASYSGQAMTAPTSKSQSGTYTVTGTSLTVTFAGKTAQTFTAVFGAPVSGVTKTVAFLGSTGPGCTFQGLMLHQ